MYSLLDTSFDFNNHKIDDELSEAGIISYEIPVIVGTYRGPVNTSRIGVVNNYLLYRSWYYYVVQGLVKYDLAEDLAKNTKVRINGDFGGMTVKDWKLKFPLKKGIDIYQIDSQKDLNYFASLMKVSSSFAEG